MTTPTPTIGHNNPPDPIDEALAPFADLLDEVSNWADGEPVTSDDAEAAVDKLIREMKTARSTVEKARKATTDPLQAAWKAELARWKVTQDDLDLQQKALVDLVAPFKAEKVRKQEEQRREAARIAREAEEAAREAARKAQAGDLEAAREAKAAQDAFDAAQAKKAATAKQAVKGMRTITTHEVVDIRALVNWIATNDKPALAEFASAYAQKNGGDIPNTIVLTTQKKEAF